MTEPRPCDLCGSTGDFLFSAKDFWLGIPGGFSIICCSGCHVWYVDPKPDAAELSRYYPVNYYSFNPRIEPKASQRKLASRRFREWRKFSRIPTPPAGGRALDLGCGIGNFL
ncbi:MAG: hypothetical protein HQL70_10235, partial [Magnetococcales bacterium]|nr:hypothetical protein [Magnetococcales bacterium]